MKIQRLLHNFDLTYKVTQMNKTKKNRQNTTVVHNFDMTRKIMKIMWAKKIRENTTLTKWKCDTFISQIFRLGS